MLTQERKEEVLGLIADLIAQKSYSGEEGGVVEVLKAYMKSHGYDDIIVDKYGNVIGKIVGKKPGPKVLFDGHIDTVPVANLAAWTKKPFDPEIIDGKMYGRGTTDMKGSVGAFTAAVGFFAADCNKDFAGELYVAGVVHEECFEGVAARSISEIVKPDYVIIGEASMCNVKIGQRGRGEIMVETFGVPAHSANPDKGVNAVYAMCKVVDAIRKLPTSEHPVLGKGILELTDIKSTPYPGASVVPSYCKATYDRRLLVGETPESVLAPLQKLIEDMMKADPSIKAKVSFAHGEEMCYTGNKIEGDRFFPGWLYSEKDQFVQDILTELRAIGQTPEITQYSFCTNGSHYAGEAGIKTVGYGPSRENLAHTDDEYAEVSELIKVAEGDYAICKALCK